MCRHHHQRPVAGGVREQLQHPFGVALVERGGRLVSQHQPRPQGQSARHRHPLPLAERELGGELAAILGQPDRLQGFVGGTPDNPVGHVGAGHLQSDDHVLERVEPGQEPVVLEDEPGVPADAFDAAQEAAVQGVPVHPDAASIGPQLAMDQAQERALARP